jgi:hypothetical protein
MLALRTAFFILLPALTAGFLMPTPSLSKPFRCVGLVLIPIKTLNFVEFSNNLKFTDLYYLMINDDRLIFSHKQHYHSLQRCSGPSARHCAQQLGWEKTKNCPCSSRARGYCARLSCGCRIFPRWGWLGASPSVKSRRGFAVGLNRRFLGKPHPKSTFCFR